MKKGAVASILLIIRPLASMRNTESTPRNVLCPPFWNTLSHSQHFFRHSGHIVSDGVQLSVEGTGADSLLFFEVVLEFSVGFGLEGLFMLVISVAGD